MDVEPAALPLPHPERGQRPLHEPQHLRGGHDPGRHDDPGRPAARLEHRGRDVRRPRRRPALDRGRSAGTRPRSPTGRVDGRVEGVPNPTRLGPDIIYIGTEGGFLPKPVVLKGQPITFVTDPTSFNVGNVECSTCSSARPSAPTSSSTSRRGAARSSSSTTTPPAAVPAFDPRFDYVTGAPDLSDERRLRPRSALERGHRRRPAGRPAGRLRPEHPHGHEVPRGPRHRARVRPRRAAGPLGAGLQSRRHHRGSASSRRARTRSSSARPTTTASTPATRPSRRCGRPGASRASRTTPHVRDGRGHHRDLPHGAEGDARRDGRLLRQGVRPHVDQPRHAAQPAADQQRQHDAVHVHRPGHRVHERGARADLAGARRRHAAVEDQPQRRGHAPHPLPHLRRAGDQPRRLGRPDPAARSAGARLEGHRPHRAPRGHHRGDAPLDAADAVQHPVQHAPPEPGHPARAHPARATASPTSTPSRRRRSSRPPRTPSSASPGSTCGTATSSATKRTT